MTFRLFSFRRWFPVILALQLVPLAPRLIQPEARAAQTARISSPEARVYERPTLTSEVVGTLERGLRIDISTFSVQGPEGATWYKVRMPNGVLGYVRAGDLMSEDLQRERERSQHEFEGPASLRDSGRSWCFTARALGLGAYTLDQAGEGSAAGEDDGEFSPGAEGEVSTCIPFSSSGYLHRMLGLGAAYVWLPDDRYVLGSLIYRFYSDTLTEPELRLRAGLNTDSALVAGGSVTIRRALSRPDTFFFSLYLDAGALLEVAEENSSVFSIGLGIGAHF